MSVNGPTKEEYDNFKKEGGELVFEIDAEEISESKDYEAAPSIKLNLKTGFELPPIGIGLTGELEAAIVTHGREWNNIVCTVYSQGGRIIYKQLPNGKYEAKCEIPSKVS